MVLEIFFKLNFDFNIHYFERCMYYIYLQGYHNIFVIAYHNTYAYEAIDIYTRHVWLANTPMRAHIPGYTSLSSGIRWCGFDIAENPSLTKIPYAPNPFLFSFVTGTVTENMLHP